MRKSVSEVLIEGLSRNRSEHQYLDPGKRGKGRLKLDDYMLQRDILLTARYG